MLLTVLAQVTTVPATGENAIDFTWLFIKMLLLLGVVSIAAVLILKYAVPHIGVMKRFQHGKHFKVIGRHALEPGKSLYLVQTGKKYFVLGAADHGINLIKEIEEDDLKHES